MPIGRERVTTEAGIHTQIGTVIVNLLREMKLLCASFLPQEIVGMETAADFLIKLTRKVLAQRGGPKTKGRDRIINLRMTQSGMVLRGMMQLECRIFQQCKDGERTKMRFKNPPQKK